MDDFNKHFYAGILILISVSILRGADATWDGGSGVDGNFSTVANWVGDPTAPGATAGTASTDIATFSSAIANTWGNGSGNPIVIDAGRNLGGLTFDTSSGSYFIGSTGGNALQLTSGAVIRLNSTLSSGATITETLNAPIVLNGATTFQNNSTSGAGANSGILNFGGGITGGVAGATTLTLQGTNTNANTLSGIIGNGASAGVAVTKSEAGKWVLSGANTYSGTTTVNAGTLRGTDIASFGSGGIVVNAGGTLEVGSGTANDTLVNNVTVNGTSTVITDRSTSGAGIQHTMGTLTTTDGTSTITMKGGTNSTSGTNRFVFSSADVASGTTFDLIKNSSSTAMLLNLGYISNNGDVTFKSSDGTSASSQIRFGGAGTNAQRLTRTSGEVTLDMGNQNTAGVSILGNAGNVTNYFGTTGVTLNLKSGQMQMSTDVSIAAYNTRVSGDFTIVQTTQLSATGTTNTFGTLSIGANTLTVKDVSGGGPTSGTSKVVFGATTLTGNATFSVSQNNSNDILNLTLGAISDGGNGYTITKTGNDTLELVGANTHSGATTNSAGTLKISNQLALQNSTLTMNGGSLSLDSSVGANAFTMGGLAAASSGAGYDIALQNSAATAIALTVGGNNTNTTYAAVLSGGGSLIKTGTGTTTFSGGSANTFTGTVNVTGGTLALTKTAGVNAIANNTITIGSGATLSLGASNQIGDTATMALNGGTFSTNGNSETLGTLSATANSFLDFGSGVSAIVFADSSATLTANSLSITNFTAGSDTLRFGGAAGTVDLTRIIFTDFGGATGVNDGTGFITANVTTVSGGAVLASAITGTNVVNQNTANTTVTVTGNNTSSGTATVSAGTLVIGTTAAGGNWAGNVVETGGILKGSGTISGSLTLNGGSYSAGNSPGIQNVGSFTVNAGGTHLVEIDGATAGNGVGFYDQTISAGAVTLNGGTLQGSTVFSGSTGYLPAYGTKITFLKGSSITGSYATYDFSSNTNGLSFMPEYWGTEVNLYAVPANWGVNVAGMNVNQTRIGKTIERFKPGQIDNRSILNDREKIFNGLMRLDNNGIKSAYDQLSPERLAAMSASVTQFSMIGNGATAQRLTQLRYGDHGVSLNGVTFQSIAGDYDYELMALDKGVIPVAKRKSAGKQGFFVNTTGAYAQVDSDSKRIGFENRLEGLTAGIDRELNRELAVGIFMNQGYADTILDGGGTLQSNTGRVGVYGGYHKGGFYLNSSLAGGITSFESKRKLAFLGESADGSTEGLDLSGQLSSGVDFQTGKWVWGPVTKIDYGSQWIQGFSEKGSAARLRVTEQQSNFAETGFGIKVSRPFDYKGWKWIPEVHLLGSYQWVESNKIHAKFAAGGESFSMHLENSDREQVIPGVGVTVLMSPSTSMNLRYESRVNSTASSHQLDFGISKHF